MERDKLRPEAFVEDAVSISVRAVGESMVFTGGILRHSWPLVQLCGYYLGKMTEAKYREFLRGKVEKRTKRVNTNIKFVYGPGNRN